MGFPELRGKEGDRYLQPGLFLQLMLDCGSLDLLPVPFPFLMMAGLGSDQQVERTVIRNGFIGFLFQLCLVLPLGSWSSRQCWAWAPFHSMGFKLDQSLDGHSHKFCVTMAHFVGWTDALESKVLWLGWCPSDGGRSLVK